MKSDRELESYCRYPSGGQLVSVEDLDRLKQIRRDYVIKESLNALSAKQESDVKKQAVIKRSRRYKRKLRKKEK